EEVSSSSNEMEEEQLKARTNPVLLWGALLLLGCVGMVAVWFLYLNSANVSSKEDTITVEKTKKQTLDDVSDVSFGRTRFKKWTVLSIYEEKGLADAAKAKQTGFTSISFKEHEISGKGFSFFKNENVNYVYAAKSRLNDEGARELSQL